MENSVLTVILCTKSWLLNLICSKWEDAQPIHDGTWKQLWRQKNLQFEWNVEVLKSRSDITAKNSNRTILRRYEPEEGPHSINVRGNRKFTAADGRFWSTWMIYKIICRSCVLGSEAGERDKSSDFYWCLFRRNGWTHWSSKVSLLVDHHKGWAFRLCSMLMLLKEQNGTGLQKI